MLFTEDQLGKMNAKHAVVSLSGGMDSTTVLLKCLKEFETVTALSFDYGQKHRVELERAQSLVNYLNTSGFNIKYRVIKLDGLTECLKDTMLKTI
jgi:7-cyano-7-deazaguanine synthase